MKIFQAIATLPEARRCRHPTDENVYAIGRRLSRPFGRHLPMATGDPDLTRACVSRARRHGFSRSTGRSVRARRRCDADQIAYFPGRTHRSALESGEARAGDDRAEALNDLNTFPRDDEGQALRRHAYYRGLSHDALRVLAGLPGNERAFTQITIQPLDADDPELADRPGPDNDSEDFLSPTEPADLHRHIGWTIEQQILLPLRLYRWRAQPERAESPRARRCICQTSCLRLHLSSRRYSVARQDRRSANHR